MSEWGSGYDSDGPDPWDPWDYELDHYLSSSPSSVENPVANLDFEKFVHGQPTKRLLPLKELCCRFVGQNFPFGIVQLYLSPIPVDVQQRIAFWAFPTDGKKLLATVALSGISEHDCETARTSNVEDVLQSGMYLTGTISPPVVRTHRSYSQKVGKIESFRAYVQFDRGCITASNCSCSKQGWCSHVLALCFARMNESSPLQLYPPISETLSGFDRVQLQKLVQYLMEKLPLHGVAAMHELASSLLDKGSEMNSISGAPDLTAGGFPGDRAVWKVDKDSLFCRLESIYEMKMRGSSRSYEASFSGLQDHKSKLLGFKEFFTVSTLSSSSEVYQLLLDEDDNLSVVLHWGLGKLTKEEMPERLLLRSHSQDLDQEQAWNLLCFSKVLFPVMEMFFVSPAMSSRVKEDMTERLSDCLSVLPSGLLASDLLHCVHQVATKGIIADVDGRRQLLNYLQQAVAEDLTPHNPDDSNTGATSGTDPILLHCGMAVMQYMKFYNCASEKEMEEMASAMSALLFPAILADVASQMELVAVCGDHVLEQISFPILVEYGTVLLQCSKPDQAAELVFKLLGNKLSLSMASTHALVYRNWAESVLIAVVDEAELFSEASPEVHYKLAELSIQWLKETCHSLEQDPNLAATLMGMWCMMRLVCHCTKHNCLQVIRQMTQELIDLMSLKLTITAPTPQLEEGSADSDLLMETMAESFISLLVDLFTMLPADGCQELFTTLYKVYPKPLDAKRSKAFSPHSHRYRWYRKPDTLSLHYSSAFFPREPVMEDIDRQLVIARPYTWYHRTKSTISDDERAEIFRVQRTQCSVFPRHISFLENLLKRLQKKRSPLQFQMHLLVSLVSNCLSHDWVSRKHCHSNTDDILNLDDRCSCCDSLQLSASDDIGFGIEALKEMWKFSIAPQEVLELLEVIQDQVRSQPRGPDIVCEILISLLDCETSLNLRVFQVMITIGAKPKYILQAVDIASSSINDSKQNIDHCMTTAIQCAEMLGVAYNEHKASGAAEQTLLELRLRAVDFLQHAKSILADRGASKFMRQKGTPTVNVQALKQIVYDSGQQALTELLALVVMIPGQSLLPTLEGMNELCDYYCKDTDTSANQSKLMKVSPFKESVAKLLEIRKENIKKIVGRRGNVDRQKSLLDDLKLSFQFLGDEEGLKTHMSFLRTLDRRFSMTSDSEDGEKNPFSS